jgi:hypothetical protein
MKFWHIPAAIAAGAIVWAVYHFMPTDLQYRWTIEVDTPQGVASASSVIVARFGKQIPLMGGPANYLSFRGEAPAIVLPDGQVLVAMLHDGTYFASLPTVGVVRGSSVPKIRLTGDDAKDWDVLRRIKPLITIAPYDYPRFARIRRADDPGSLAYVEPSDVTATFGPGYAIRRITVQPTDDLMSPNIDKILPWLGTMKYLPIAGDQIPFGPQRKVGVKAFRKTSFL